MTRYVKITASLTGATSGFIPVYLNFVGASNEGDQIQLGLIDLSGVASQPVTGGQIGQWAVPDGATSLNVMFGKADGTWESKFFGNLGETNAVKNITLTNAVSSYMIFSGNCYGWLVHDAAESACHNFKHGSTQLVWKMLPNDRSHIRIYKEMVGYHIFFTDGTQVQLNGSDYAIIPSVTGQRVESNHLTTKQIQLDITPDAYNVLATINYGTDEYSSYVGGDPTFTLSSHINGINYLVKKDGYVDGQGHVLYSDTSSTKQCNLVPYPVLSIKSSDPNFTISCDNQTTNGTTKTIVCSPGTVKSFTVTKSGSDFTYTGTVTVSTDTEVDAADYSEYFLAPVPGVLHSVIFKSTNPLYSVTYNNVTADSEHPFTIEVESGTTIHFTVWKWTEPSQSNEVTTRVTMDIVVDAASYAPVFSDDPIDDPGDDPVSCYVIRLTNHSPERVTLFAIKNGSEYSLGTCDSGQIADLAYEPASYWNLGAWKGLAGFEYFIDFKVRSDSGKAHTFQVVSFQADWPSISRHTIETSSLVDEDELPPILSGALQLGAGLLGALLLIILLVVLLRR